MTGAEGKAHVLSGGIRKTDRIYEQSVETGGRSFISSTGLKIRVNYTGKVTVDEAFLEYLTKCDLYDTPP